MVLNQTTGSLKPNSFIHMEGRALTWYHWLMDARYAGGWEDFVSALRTRFSPSAFDDPVGAFTKLKQTSNVEDYQTQFEILSNKIQGLSEEFKVSTFLSGLREEVRFVVTMLKPKDLTTAFGLARLQEEEVKLRSKGYKYSAWGTNSQGYTKLASTQTHLESLPLANQTPAALPLHITPTEGLVSPLSG